MYINLNKRVDKADTLQAESSLSELSFENKGFRSRGYPRQPLQGAVFALHARENRVFYVRGDFPSDNSPISQILSFSTV